MPAEIIAQHPALTPAKMNYTGSKIYTQGVSYDEYVNNALESKQASKGVTIGIGLK